ncbi:MAG: zinc ribbon domain-containing protein [Candidatus Hadarchaeota archaeon]
MDKTRRQEARKEALDLDKKLGVAPRVFSLRIIRPFDERIEKDFRDFKKELYDDYKKRIETAKRTGKDIGKLKKEFKKERSRKIRSFFEEKKKQHPDIYTFDEMMAGFRGASELSRRLYNKAITKSYLQFDAKEKVDHYNNVVEAAKELGQEDLPSDFITGVSKKIQSNFRRKELAYGTSALPTAGPGFPIPFYLSQGGQQEKKSLIDFQIYTDSSGKLLESKEFMESSVKGPRLGDDFILEFKTPVERDEKIIFEKRQFLCSTQKRRRNFKRSRDDATNKLIMDYLTGNIEKGVEEFLKKKSSEKLITAPQAEILQRKYTHIPQYEIQQKMVRFKNTPEFFAAVTVSNIPKDIAETSESVLAGIDFCYSKSKILYLSIIDMDKRNLNKQKVEDWQLFAKPFYGDNSKNSYGMRKIYDDYYSEKRKVQSKLSRKIEPYERGFKFQLRFENRRKYAMRKIVADITELVKKYKVSKVSVENLEGLRNKEDWFTVNKIRNFPRAAMMNMLKQKLEGAGIIFAEISPKNTSKACSICGKTNEDFTFKYRSSNGFPPFTCKDESCRFSKDKSKISQHELWLRDADQNSARNIATKGLL